MLEKNNIKVIKTARLNKTKRRLDALGWGLFFIWIGTAFLAGIEWGGGLTGVGTIILGVLAARKASGLRLAGFWVVLGFLFLLCGIWELFNVPLDLTPILCIFAGLVLLISVLVGNRRNHQGGHNQDLSETPKSRPSNQDLNLNSNFSLFL